MLERLLKDHDRIRVIAAELEAHMLAPCPAKYDHIENCRWSLSREMHHHLAVDERMVLVPLEQSRQPNLVAAAAVSRVELEIFYSDFNKHVAAWQGVKVLRDWPRYTASVLRLIERLKLRLAREERELYPLLAPISAQVDHAITRNWAGNAWAVRSNIMASS